MRHKEPGSRVLVGIGVPGDNLRREEIHRLTTGWTFRFHHPEVIEDVTRASPRILGPVEGRYLPTDALDELFVSVEQLSTVHRPERDPHGLGSHWIDVAAEGSEAELVGLPHRNA
jgi:hypothetical protein